MLSAAERFELGRAETALLRGLVSWSTTTGEPFETDEPVDWPSLVDSAERHRLSPLLWLGMRRTGVLGRVPSAERGRLDNIRNLELAKAIVRLHHVDELGAVAFEEGRDLCLLKGAAFTACLYPEPGLRPMADIDLLSSEEEAKRWGERLERLGYVPIDRGDHATCFRRRQTGVLVELHHQLVSSAPYLGLRTEELLERSIPIETVDGMRLRTLGWEDHLLHLALHASFQHGFRQPAVNAWDARSIADRTDFDVETFVERASRSGLAHWVYGGLAMCEAVFAGPKLRQAREGLEGRVSARIARKASAFRPETLLASSAETVFGAPYRRIAWNGPTTETLALLWELSRPRRRLSAGSPASRLARILQLIRNHGIGIVRSTRRRRECPTIRSRPASLGEVRDV